MKTAYRSVLFILVLFICNRTTAQTVDTTLVEFVQGDKVYAITSDAGTVTLEKKPFSVRFYSRRYNDVTEKYYAASIAVLDKPDNGIEVGMDREEIPFFAGGTGIAMSTEDDGTIFLSEDGHHYLYYASEEDRRLTFLSKHGDWLKLEWPIRSLFANDTDSAIEQLKYDKLYFVFLFDRNLNDMIDGGELKKVVVTFR